MSLHRALFAGFEQKLLFKTTWPGINAIRITMRPPERAAQLQAYLKTDIIDGDVYEGYLLDTNSATPSEFQTYEIPINCMTLIPDLASKLVPMVTIDQLHIEAILFEVRGQTEGEASFDIQKIDLVYNPELMKEEFISKFRMPVFYKVPRDEKLIEAGIDTGREIISLKSRKPEFIHQQFQKPDWELEHKIEEKEVYTSVKERLKKI